jgi:hypothetical protein
MKKTSIVAIKLALAVEFVAILSVPVVVASNEGPRAVWFAEWVRPDVAERTFGVFRLRDGAVSFDEQVGQGDWMLDLSSVKRVTASNGRVIVTSTRGEEFAVVVMGPNMTAMSPKNAVAAIERAIQVVTTNSR